MHNPPRMPAARRTWSRSYATRFTPCACRLMGHQRYRCSLRPFTGILQVMSFNASCAHVFVLSTRITLLQCHHIYSASSPSSHMQRHGRDEECTERQRLLRYEEWAITLATKAARIPRCRSGSCFPNLGSFSTKRAACLSGVCLNLG